MRVIYAHGHPSITLPGGRVVRRLGDPVEVPDALGRELVARGDFVEYVPEPKRRPVQTKPPKK